MRRLFFISISAFLSTTALAQLPDIPVETREQLEAATENNADNQPTDDSYLQQLQQFIKNPIDLNTADENDLEQLQLLTPIQIESIISYRNLLGNFIDIYELQAVPALNIELIGELRIFVTVSQDGNIITSIRKRLKGGNHSALARTSQVLEKSKGYLLNASTATNFYPGSPQNMFIRYKYSYKNLLQYGIVGEKDAGEQFFRSAQKQGFDFYSAHFFARNIGIVKALAIGDFTANFGQGLTQWQNLAFKKGVDVINIKRQSPILAPYNSPGEIFFNRGIGITIETKYLQTTAFVSYRKLDGNFNAADSLNDAGFVSSLETSGYHRTQSEVADKGLLHQLSFGGNISYNKNNFHIGVNGVQYHFNLPINKADEPYNLFALNGKNFGNYSIDYSYTINNAHFFGEAATTNNFDKAFISGLLLSTDATIDMSFLYRNISKSYQTLYGNAFTENTYPTNEQGFYTGISIHPNSIWRIDAYADFFKFPWLKYLVDAPSSGTDYFLQATYSPNKQLQIYTRYEVESKAADFNPDQLTLSPVVQKPIQNWRAETSFKLNPVLTFRNRVELLWYDKNGPAPENGFLANVDFIYKPSRKKYSGNMRLQYFETDSYNSRVYAFEDDVLYSYSIPVFFNKGTRYYFNLAYRPTKNLVLMARWSQTIYNNQNTIGTGLDEINGNKKTEIELQAMYQF